MTQAGGAPFDPARPPDPLIDVAPYVELAARRAAPLPGGRALWLVGGRKEARVALGGDAFSSIVQGDGGVALVCPESGRRLRPEETLLASDGAAHQRLRRALMAALATLPTDEGLEIVHRSATGLLERWRNRGAGRFLASLAVPIQDRWAHWMLGLPRNHLGSFREEVGSLMTSLEGPIGNPERHRELTSRLIDRLWRGGIRDPAAEERGLLVGLGRLRAAGEIDAVEALNLAITVIQGSTRTAGRLAVEALRRLLGSDRQATPDDARRAVGEAFRASPPVHTLFRTSTRAVRLGSERIPPGAVIAVCLRATALDETAGSLLGFGAGPHTCPRGRLGYRVAEILVEQSIATLPGLRLAAGNTRRSDDMVAAHPVFSGPRELHLRWDRA